VEWARTVKKMIDRERESPSTIRDSVFQDRKILKLIPGRMTRKRKKLSRKKRKNSMRKLEKSRRPIPRLKKRKN
jgi:hypothetical protein